MDPMSDEGNILLLVRRLENLMNSFSIIIISLK